MRWHQHVALDMTTILLSIQNKYTFESKPANFWARGSLHKTLQHKNKGLFKILWTNAILLSKLCKNKIQRTTTTTTTTTQVYHFKFRAFVICRNAQNVF